VTGESPAGGDAPPENLPSDEVGERDAWLKAQYLQEIRDASELLTFAVARGRRVPDATIDAIKAAEQHLTTGEFPAQEDRAAFEKAYRDLARTLAPVTIDSLHATDNTAARQHWLLAPKAAVSEGKLWSRKLTLLTLMFLLIIFVGDNGKTIVNHPLFTADYRTGSSILGLGLASWQVIAGLFGAVVPFAYGGLGACAFLLKTCHVRLHRREFDPRRIPEYYSRTLLGFVSGGAILLFINPQDTTTQIGAAGLAFLTGYNTDFLFSTIERLAAALLPKDDGAAATGKAAPAVDASVSLDRVLEQYGKAGTPEEKKVLAELIQRLQERL